MPGTESPTISINGIECTVLYDSGVAEMSPEDGGPQAKVIFQCLWSDRFNLWQAILPWAQRSGDNIYRHVPYAYPPAPGLFCMSVSNTVGVKMRTNQFSGWPEYELAQVTAEFRVPLFQFVEGDPKGQNDPSGLPWVVTRIGLSGEVFSPPTPKSAYVFQTSGKPVPNSSIGIPRPKIDISQTSMFLPLVPLAEVEPFIGQVNNNPIKLGSKTFAKGTVLLLGMQANPFIDPLGNLCQNVEYRMIGNGGGIDWNEFLNESGSYELINTASGGGGSYPFPYSDFYWPQFA